MTPDTDRKILSQMFRETALVSLGEKHGKPFVELREPQSPDSVVTIMNVPADAVVLKVDAFDSPDSIFKGEKGECKRADYAIISAEKKCILYIEIKSVKDEWPQIVKQLKGAECVVKYCREIGKTFWEENSFLSDYTNRFISIGHTRVPLRKTKITDDEGLHDAPERAMKIDWPHFLQFNRLAGLKRNRTAG